MARLACELVIPSALNVVNHPTPGISPAFDCAFFAPTIITDASAVMTFATDKICRMGKEGDSQGLEDYLSVKYMCVAGLDA